MPYNRDRCLLRVCDAVYECGGDCPYGKACILKLVRATAQNDSWSRVICLLQQLTQTVFLV